MTTIEKNFAVNWAQWGHRAGIAGLAALVGLSGGCAKEVEEPELIRPVRVMRVAAPGELTGRSFPGRARAVEETNLSFDVAGTVLVRPVKVGDEVTRGQLLARLDQRDFKNQLDAAVATRNRMRANLERVQIAAETGAVARQDVDDAQARFDVAQADVNIAQKRIQDAEIVAPRDGTISATYVEAFTSVQAKEPIVRLLDTSAIEMVVQIPENLISLAPHVQNVAVTYDAFPDQPVLARIKEISNEASLTTRTFPVTLIMEQPEEFKILPGMAGQARGEVRRDVSRQAAAYQLPVSAIFTPDDKGASGASFVWVVDESSNSVTKRPVTTGELDRFGILVTDGVQSGELVVIGGVSFLREGQTVRPQEVARSAT